MKFVDGSQLAPRHRDTSSGYERSKDPHAGAWTGRANMADTLENRSGKGRSWPFAEFGSWLMTASTSDSQVFSNAWRCRASSFATHRFPIPAMRCTSRIRPPSRRTWSFASIPFHLECTPSRRLVNDIQSAIETLRNACSLERMLIKNVNVNKGARGR